MTPPQFTNPKRVNQATIEDADWGVNLTDLLASLPVPGSFPTAVTAQLQPISSQTNRPGAAIPLQDDPDVDGNVISQRVRGTALTADRLYRLTFLFTPNGTTNVLAEILEIECSF